MIYDLVRIFIFEPKIDQLVAQLRQAHKRSESLSERLNKAYKQQLDDYYWMKNCWKDAQGNRDKVWKVYQSLRRRYAEQHSKVQKLEAKLEFYRRKEKADG